MPAATAVPAAPAGDELASVDYRKPGMGVMKVSPKDARLLLEGNIHNRNLNEDHVNALADAIVSGEWQLTFDPIRLSADGTLLDGQHRLVAIIKASRTVRVLVVWGLPNAVQEVIDIGQKRSLASMLKLRGEKNSHVIAAILHFIWKYENDAFLTARKKPSPQALIRILEENPGIREEVSLVHRVRRRVRLAPGIIGGAHYIFSQIDDDDADLFFEYLIDPIRSDPDDPIYVLRRVIERAAAAPNMAPKPGRMAALVIKAWNFYRDGEKISNLVWKPTGRKPEPFPVAK